MIRVLSIVGPGIVGPGSVPALWSGTLARDGPGWKQVLSARGGNGDGRWVLEVRRDPDFARLRSGARLDSPRGVWIVGAQSSLAPSDSPGWSSALAERRPRRLPSLGTSSGDMGVSGSGGSRSRRWIVGAGHSVRGEPRARAEIRFGGVTLTALRIPEGARFSSGWTSAAGPLPLAAEVLGGGGRVRVRAALGGGRAPGGLLVEARRGPEPGWRVRGGLRAGGTTGGRLEIETARAGERDDASVVAGLSARRGGLAGRADIRARRDAPSRGRIELHLPAGATGLELAAETEDGRLVAGELVRTTRSSRVRLRLPSRGATRASVSVAPRIGPLRARLFAGWRRGGPSSLGVEWTLGRVD